MESAARSVRLFSDRRSGNGRSGNGSRQSGIWVLDQFTRWQAMNWDYSGHLQKAQMDVADLDADLEFRLEG